MDQIRNFRSARIDDVLKEQGYATDEQIAAGLDYQKEHRGVRLEQALLRLGIISEKQMLAALGISMGLPVEELSQISVDLAAAARIPMEMAVRYQMLPIQEEAGILTVLTNDPLNFYGLEDIRQTTGMDLDLRLCEAKGLAEEIRYYYSEITARKAVSAANRSSDFSEPIGEEASSVSGSWRWQGEALRRGIRSGSDRMKERAEAVIKHESEQTTAAEASDIEDAPVIKLLNQLIQRAYRSNASDIHVEPHENKTVVRMRMDGAMAEFVTLQKRIHLPLIARIKILGDMDIAERRLPQDGHFQVKIDGEAVNTRVSVIPTVYGEKAVIRLLVGNRPIDYADTFGMNRQDYDKLRQMLDAPNGLIYLTGPTGSGKTTTLYLVLKELAKRPVNICTIEDPVEENLPGISQCQVNQQKGLTFENGLKALLRQDPDIIMIGETRDQETAAISVRAAITGHLVLSTLHTNDAASSIIRLKDMGVEPYLTANSLVGVVAQRLLRKLCPECAKTVDADEEDWRLLGRRIARIRVPAGCPACSQTGYRGRVAIHEILVADKTVRRMIAEGASVETMREYAVQIQGMRTLKECAAELVEQGITSIDELKKAAYYHEME